MGVLQDEVTRQLHGAVGHFSIIVHARPRGGKGTQTKKLGEHLEAPVFSSGELSRLADLPPNVAAIRDAGDLIPTEDFFRYVLPCVGGPEYEGEPLILDAVGRMSGEEVRTMQVMAEQGHPVVAVVYIDVSEDETRRRGEFGRKGGEVRPDDTPEKHENRLRWFQDHTLPVIDFYRQQGMLVEINGEQTEEDVTIDILLGLHDLLLCSK